MICIQFGKPVFVHICEQRLGNCARKGSFFPTRHRTDMLSWINLGLIEGSCTNTTISPSKMGPLDGSLCLCIQVQVERASQQQSDLFVGASGLTPPTPFWPFKEALKAGDEIHWTSDSSRSVLVLTGPTRVDKVRRMLSTRSNLPVQKPREID